MIRMPSKRALEVQKELYLGSIDYKIKESLLPNTWNHCLIVVVKFLHFVFPFPCKTMISRYILQCLLQLYFHTNRGLFFMAHGVTINHTTHPIHVAFTCGSHILTLIIMIQCLIPMWMNFPFILADTQPLRKFTLVYSAFVNNHLGSLILLKNNF